MTPKAFFDAFQTLLKGMVWTGTANKIFGDNVHLVSDSPEVLLSRFAPPTLFIKDTGATPFPNHPYLLNQKFTIGFFVENMNNAFGQGIYDGANRTTNTSRGAGLLDIENEVLGQIMKTNTLSSTAIRIVEESKAPLSTIKSNNPSVLRIWAFSVLVNIF